MCAGAKGAEVKAKYDFPKSNNITFLFGTKSQQFANENKESRRDILVLLPTLVIERS